MLRFLTVLCSASLLSASGWAAPRAKIAPRASAPAAKAARSKAVARLPAHNARMSTSRSLAPPPPRRETSIAPREVSDPNDPHEKRIAKLRDRLLQLLRDRPLNRTKVGVEVVKASDGDVLFAHNASVPFNPASNTKMLTTAAALAYLGGDFRYHTAVHGPAPDAEGVIKGDVYLRGSGDPSLTSTDLAEIAHRLAERGVVRIEGNLYADPRFHDPAKGGSVGEGALILNRNTYSVRVRPTDPGRPPIVDVLPRSDLFTVENRATTVKGKRSRLKIGAWRNGNKIVVSVKGRIVETRGDYVDVHRLADGASLAAHVLGGALEDFGIELTGEPAVGTPETRDLVLLGEHRSAPLTDVCKISNKPSNNFVAEAIYKTVGAELYGLPGTLAKGTRAIIEYLTELGIKPGGYRIINGSGLTHENRITPSDLASMLRKVYFDLSVAPEFLTSLAIGGIDGTIRNRFQGTDAVGLVRAKTGTLSGVSALSGYVGDKDDVLIFTIFVQGFRHKRLNEVRHAQVRMVQAMLHYLRDDAHSPVGEPNDEQPGERPIDSEADGDPLL